MLSGLDHLQAMLRSLVLNCMTKFEHTATIEEALQRFDQHVKGEKQIIADIRAAVYKAVFSTGDDKTYETMVKVKKTYILAILVAFYYYK